MKIVIDIPDEDYNVIIANADFYKANHWGAAVVWDAIVSGMPLPKGHGRLIETDALIQHTYSAVVDGVETDIIDVSNVDNAPTVIEADK